MVRPNHTDPTDILGDLRDRIFAMVNNRLNETFSLPGQEPFNAIKYNVSGDEYRCGRHLRPRPIRTSICSRIACMPQGFMGIRG